MLGDIIQPTHLVLILFVALLVLGPKRLPEVGRGLGKGIRDFRGGLAGVDESPAESVAGAPPLYPEAVGNTGSASTIQSEAISRDPEPSERAD
jgi:sec-independent protein translocase protein TatA